GQVDAEAEFDAPWPKACHECRHYLALVEIDLAAEEQTAAEAAGEVGLKERNFLSIVDTPRDAAGEPVKITQRGAATSGSRYLAGRCRITPVGGVTSEIQHRLLGAFTRAPRRQHAPATHCHQVKASATVTAAPRMASSKAAVRRATPAH
ncbi:hypothetical protein, partial [Mesorhizobium silamurunense]